MLLMSGTITISVQRSKSTYCMSRILQISKVGSWVMNLCSRLFLLTRCFVVYCKRVLSMRVLSIRYLVLSIRANVWVLSLNSGMGCLQRRQVSSFNCLTSQVLCSAKVALFLSLLGIPTPCAVPFSAEEAGSVHICEFYVKLLSLLLLQSKSTQNPNNYYGGEIRFSSLLLFLVLRDLFSSLF